MSECTVASPIGDFVELQRGTTYQGKLVGLPGPVLLGLGSIEPGGGFREEKYKTYGGECPAKLMLYPGDMYVALKGATKDGSMIGSVARVPPHVTSGRLTQDTVGLALKDKRKVLADHIYWMLRTPQYRHSCSGCAAGSAVVALSREDFLSFEVPPITDASETLVQILEALEEKIELNRKQNRTLEAIAQALFKRWFVEFEFPDENGRPYKSSGGAMQPSELGEIPVGWEVKPLDQIADYLNGLALQKYPPEGDEYLPVIKVREMKQGVTANSDKASTKLDPKYIVDDGDVLFSWSGSLEVDIWCHGKGALNQHLFKVTSEDYPKWFYYLWTKHHLRAFQAVAADKATTMGHIQRGHLSDALTVCPAENEFSRMSAIFEPLIDKIITKFYRSKNRIQSPRHPPPQTYVW